MRRRPEPPQPDPNGAAGRRPPREPTVYDISLDRVRMQIDTIHGFLRTAHWSEGVRRDVVERAIAHSEVAGAFEIATGRQVGFARVVTDHATFAWLCDVFVAEAHRARGLARRMIEALEAQPGMSGLRRWCLATRDAHGLYRRLGYELVDPDRWMVRRSPPETWREAGWTA